MTIIRGKIDVGLFLISINGKDVKYESFDYILDAIGIINILLSRLPSSSSSSLLGDAPEEVSLEFIKPNDVFKGPAIVTVITPDGKSLSSSLSSWSSSYLILFIGKKTINTVKGLNLRAELLGSGIDVYSGKSKLTNCGGGRTCGTCNVRVVDNKDWDPTPEVDRLRLKRLNDPTARLSCNTIIEGDCTVYTLPPKSE